MRVTLLIVLFAALLLALGVAQTTAASARRNFVEVESETNDELEDTHEEEGYSQAR
jgi:hypothetical protein